MKTKIIGNDTYEFYPLPAMKGVQVLTRLTQMLGPSISTLVAGLPKDIKGKPKKQLSVASVLDIDNESLGKAVATLAGVLKDDDLKYLIDQMFGPHIKVHKTVNGTSVVQDLTVANADLHFAGNVIGLMKVLIHAIRENLGDFLGDVGNSPSA